MKKGKKLKTYLPFAMNVFQRKLSYRADAVIFILGQAIMLAVTYYLWKAVYGSSTSGIINGFSLNEMIIYILISFITSVIISADILSDMYREVKDGSIAINLIRPISYEKRMIFQGIGNVMYNFVVIFVVSFIIITIIYYRYFGSLNLFNIIVYFVSTILGILINLYYRYAFGLLSFKITNMWGLSQMMGAVSELLSGALIPIVFFPKVIQWMFNFLPFSSMIYTPTMIYLGKLTGVELIKAIGIQVIWLGIIMAIARVMWSNLIKKITILGG
ncbi:ABC-2 family transporter protein [Clostridium sp.]|uniref:ABC transporter permease n=1 Tax=Clostridium sp. TaxID=1506 RepID=UPI0028512551|nr:ABC-2 family transporter protein [Clostridium sp.]MDR3596972.1 ABC-2 family transporter protein [Clostridium sp.]